MDRIAIAGLSIHGTNVEGLQQVVRPADDKALRDLADALGASELVFLATCNRVEVIYAREEGEPPGEADLDVLARSLACPGLRLHVGREAARHLFRVAASLDSLVIGEDQIVAQVREAYGHSADMGLVGPLLSPLFHHALAVGKRVRSETDLARHPVSVVSLAVSELARRLEAAVDAGPPVVGVVGAGRMGNLLARVLGDAGFAPAFIANRTTERGRALAAECAAQAVSLEDFAAGRHPVDAVLSATGSPAAVLDARAVANLARLTPSGRPLIAIDLAVPRDIETVGGGTVIYVGIDDLRAAAEHNRLLRLDAAGSAERLVDEKVEVFSRRVGESAAAPAVSDLQEATNEILDRELAGLLTGRLAHLDDPDRAAVERWARSTFKRLMHLPISALKQLATDMSSNGHGEHDEEDGGDGNSGGEA